MSIAPLPGGEPSYINAWDIDLLHNQEWLTRYSRLYGCPSGKECMGSVGVSGKCYYAGSVNYVLFGLIVNKCLKEGDVNIPGGQLIWLYKRNSPNYQASVDWYNLGFSGWPDAGGGSMPESDRPNCTYTDKNYDGPHSKIQFGHTATGGFGSF